MIYDRFKGEHANNLPTIRIQKAIIKNFKNVKYGEIVFNCGKQFVEYETKSDILGIYGQNGSGKTAFIEALAILRLLMAGSKVPNEYAECIAKGEKYSTLQFTFDLQYVDNRIRKVVYEFSLKAKLEEIETSELEYDVENSEHDLFNNKYRVNVFNEKISMAGCFEGSKKILKPVIDTSNKYTPFSSNPKQRQFIGDNIYALNELQFIKRVSLEKSQSFIFSKETLNIIDVCDLYPEYYQVILELNCFSKLFFYVVDTKASGYIRFKYTLPLYTRFGNMLIKSDRPNKVSKKMYDALITELGSINIVLGQLVPELSVGIKILSPTLLKEGSEGFIIDVIANRGDIEIPLRDESDGIKKIISILSLIIAAYNDRSCTVAIDELDAGIFEYLLGEILQTFEESGKGQLIFTSHNLRPLEVINKDFLYFTTTNPENRYVRLKGIGKTNNLRNTYFRELLLGEQNDELYNRAKKYKIVSAFRKAGLNNGETPEA